METLHQIFTVQNIVIYIIIINVIGFLAMFIDKQKAKKGAWRIPEKTLVTIALLGGSIGGMLGMYIFRHKRHKSRCSIGFPIILVVQIVLIFYCITKYDII